MAILNDTLFFAKLEAGALELDMQPMSLRAVVTSVTTGLRPLCRSREQTLTVHFANADTDTMAMLGDAQRLGQVVSNLLRYGWRGSGVPVSVR